MHQHARLGHTVDMLGVDFEVVDRLGRAAGGDGGDFGLASEGVERLADT